MTARRWAIAIAALLLLAPVALARVGGGGSFSGGGSGGDNGIVIIFWLFARLFDLHFYAPKVAVVVDLVLLGGLVAIVVLKTPKTPSFSSSDGAAAPRLSGQEISARFAALRRFDPNYSDVLFMDFVYALYARVQEARGRGALAVYAPYLRSGAIKRLEALKTPGLRAIAGVIVGAATVTRVNKAKKMMAVTVRFETNYTEQYDGDKPDNTWYCIEEWDFVRRRDVLSKPPERLSAEHCPKCGASLDVAPDGTCKQCGAAANGGEFDWGVSRLRVIQREAKGPLLNADVAEVGTDLPTIFQPGLAATRQKFLALDPAFSWERFETRAKHIFGELQAAWSERKWEKARPFESDCLFQMHEYWLTEYKRQALWNVIKEPAIGRVELVKVTADAFYDAFTIRIFASMIDYLADGAGKVISGDPKHSRPFSEYWTFVRRRGVASKELDDRHCPNCGAALKVNMAGVCEYCHGRITSGEFDWVLSRIEQDEVYQG